MRKLVILTLTLALLATVMFGLAQAEDSTWICPNCNEERDTNYCPICAAERPEDPNPPTDDSLSQDMEWVCQMCGKTWPAEYNICPDDATKKPSGSWPAMKLGDTAVSFTSYRAGGVQHQASYGPGRQYAGAAAWWSSVKPLTALFAENDYVYVKIKNRCVYFRASSLQGAPEKEIKLNYHPAVITEKVQPMLGPGKNFDILSVYKSAGSGSSSAGGTEATGESGESGGCGDDAESGDYDDYGEYGDYDDYGEYGDYEDYGEYGDYDDYGEYGDYDNYVDWGGDYAESGESEGSATSADLPGKAPKKVIKVILKENSKVNVLFEADGWVFAEFRNKYGLFRAWIPADKVAAESK